MKLEVHKDCFMVYVGTNLYIIDPKLIDNDSEKAKSLVSKIINGDKGVVILSYNGNNYNYSVDGVLINCKPTENKLTNHIKEYIIVRETPSMYATFKQRINPKAPTWVRNIFNGSAEGEITYKKTKDYYLMPDFKWDQNPEHLYLLVLFREYKLHSVRDLTNKHIAMLQNMRVDVLDYISSNFKINESKLRLYFHYQPSAWQLHMHIQHMDSPIVNSNQSSKAITLTDIIQNLEQSPDYYAKATLECIISTTDYSKYYDQVNL